MGCFLEYIYQHGIIFQYCSIFSILLNFAEVCEIYGQYEGILKCVFFNEQMNRQFNRQVF